MSRVLIGYVTKTGSTKEVAERVGDILRQNGHEVEVQRLDQVQGAVLETFESVVIGAPINGMAWQPIAKTFVEEHQAVLSEKKIAYFTLTLTGLIASGFWRRKVRSAFKKAEKMVPAVQTGIFGGIKDGPLPAPMRILFGLPKNVPDDQRDWTVIQNWAVELSKKL